MQIFRFSANFADFVVKNVIFVNRLNPLRKFGGYDRGLGVHAAYSGIFLLIKRNVSFLKSSALQRKGVFLCDCRVLQCLREKMDLS